MLIFTVAFFLLFLSHLFVQMLCHASYIILSKYQLLQQWCICHSMSYLRLQLLTIVEKVVSLQITAAQYWILYFCFVLVYLTSFTENWLVALINFQSDMVFYKVPWSTLTTFFTVPCRVISFPKVFHHINYMPFYNTNFQILNQQI